MRRLLPILMLPLLLHAAEMASGTYRPTYTKDGGLVLPAHYREWIYLTSGLGMTYGVQAMHEAAGHPMFDNVFANPEAYRRFVAEGTWPDGTVLALEERGAEEHVSINGAGHTQGALRGLEFHVKDKGQWTFYVAGSSNDAKPVERKASCYACHEQHAAVDTTFVQFYPTLLPIAEQKKTVSAVYLAKQKAAH